MSREFFLDLAKKGATLPIGADLVLHEKADVQAVMRDGTRFGEVIAEAAVRYHSPLAVPIMDLMLEKALMLRCLDIPESEIPTWHFHECPTPEQVARIRTKCEGPLDARLQANVDAVAHIATKTDLYPIGMCIGPFSLMTKLIAEPITPVYLGGMGVTAAEEPDVARLEVVLDLAMTVITRSIKAQIAAGAKAIFIAEPAGNKVYISPNQMAEGADVFERYVMTYNRRIKQILDAAGVDLVFHCCGELTDEMLKLYATLHPVMLSLGCSRNLPDDAKIVPADIVLYGNLPSKKFYSDELISVAQVVEQGIALKRAMAATGHPFILGTECDVLHVPGADATIKAKVAAFERCR